MVKEKKSAPVKAKKTKEKQKKDNNVHYVGKQILTHMMADHFKALTKENTTLREAEQWYSCFIDSIKECLRQEKEVRLTSFATFSIKKRAARVGFNPKSKQKVQLPESKRAACKMSKQVLFPSE